MGKLNYRKDKHLDFLSKLANELLDVLVNIIIKDKKGNLRDSEDLTLQPEYIVTPEKLKHTPKIGTLEAI